MMGFNKFFDISLVATFYLVPNRRVSRLWRAWGNKLVMPGCWLNGLVTIKEAKDICLQITQSTAKRAFVMKVI